MHRSVTRTMRLPALIVSTAVVVAACSNASTSSSGTSETEGVTSNSITVGGIAAATGPLANQYSPIFGAVQAYFDMVNAAGGVNGRKILYPYKLDDQTLPSLDVSQARTLVQQDHVFAVVGVATPSFPGGTYLGQNAIPTFGWNVNPEFANYPSSFGDKGSFLDFTHQGPEQAYLAEKVFHANKVGIIAYNVSQSADCATGIQNTFNSFHINVALKDTSLPFGATDISGDIQRLKDSGATYVTTCMDPTGNTLLSRSLQEAGLYSQVAQSWPNGYDQATLAQYQNLMQGVYFGTGNVPYTHGYTQGMDQYLDAMASHHLPVGDVTAGGWIVANLFVTGLQMAGKDLTRSKLVDKLNTLTHFTANGMEPGIDWTQQHTGTGPFDCTAFLQVRGNTFVPVAGPPPTNPFLCFGGIHATEQANLNTVPFPESAASFFNG